MCGRARRQQRGEQRNNRIPVCHVHAVCTSLFIQFTLRVLVSRCLAGIWCPSCDGDKQRLTNWLSLSMSGSCIRGHIFLLDTWRLTAAIL
jgi:hypothetical protein